LTDKEGIWLERISRSRSEPAIHVARAKQILHVADGPSYTEAVRSAGCKPGDAVSNLVKQFNQEALNAIQPRHGGGPAANAWYASDRFQKACRELWHAILTFPGVKLSLPFRRLLPKLILLSLLGGRQSTGFKFLRQMADKFPAKDMITHV
jgi:hypothetical protein